MSGTENNRMLRELERAIRNLNREIINPAIPQLTVSQLRPMLAMVARSRAIYLKELLELASVVGEEGQPTTDQLARLRSLRQSYDELVKGVVALETAIERGYLDVAI